MKRFLISYYKTENISPDERNAMRSNQGGIWLSCGWITAETPRKAITAARKDFRADKFRTDEIKDIK